MRAVYVVIAIALLAAGLLPAFHNSASAAQITSRSIEMSSSTPSATSVKYDVTFNIGTTSGTTMQAIIVDFCDNDPILTDTTCSLPAGFTLTASPTVSAQDATAGCNLSTFTTVATLNSNRTFELSAASAVSTTAGTTCTFTINGITNPNNSGTGGANHPFYARIYTFDTTAHASAYSPGVTTNVIDDGGIALSTSALITISATVMETLQFCVAGAAWSANCGGAPAGPALIVGHGSPAVINSSAVDVASAFTQLSTDASSGAIVRMKASNVCTNGGLSTAPPDSSGGCLSIPGIGSTATALVAGTADFGMCVNKGGSTTVTSTYNDTAHSCPTTWTSGELFGMNGANLTSTYGDQIFSTTTSVSSENNTCVFGATASNTTPAGVYQGNEALIATGTF